MPGIEVAGVGELVDGAARDAKHLAGADLVSFALDRPDECPLEAVDRLLETVMAVRRRHLGAGGDVELEHRHVAVRLLALEQEADRHLPDLDLLACACCHRSSPSSQLAVKCLDSSSVRSKLSSHFMKSSETGAGPFGPPLIGAL